MKLNFRQGIQLAPLVSGQPSFLTYNAGNNTITVSVGVEMIRATAAWKDVNYLIEERENITSAWGPFPLSATYHLYWDINLATGAVTRGTTTLAPEIASSAPVTPAVDQHWYDSTNNLMKVWDGGRWVEKARVFAASFLSGSHAITQLPLGSQVGISVPGAQDTWFDHGYILYGIDQKAIKNSDGSMVTTAVPLNTYHGSFSSPIRLELANSTALAKEPIAAFCAISAFGDGSVQLASGTNAEKRPIGITTLPVIAGEPVDIVFKGIVYNDQWDWDYTLGKDLYCGDTGIPFQNNGSYTAATRIGAILDNKTVLIDIDLFGTATGGGGGISWPLLAPTEYNSPNVVIPFSFEDSPATGLQLIKGSAISNDPYSWVATYGESFNGESAFYDDVYAESTAYDSLGNSYTVGADGNNNSNLSFVVKYNQVGEVVWQKKFLNNNGINELTFQDIAIDSSNNVYVCGTETISDYYGTSIIPCLLKLTPDGVVVWQIKLDDAQTYQQRSRGITVDALGNVIVIGSSAVTDYYGSNDTIFVCKVTPGGVITWTTIVEAKDLAASFVSSSYANGVSTDTAGNIYVSGSGVEHSSTNEYAIAFKLSAAGALGWTTALYPEVAVGGTSSSSSFYDNQADSSSNVYIAGEHNDGVSNFGSVTMIGPTGVAVWSNQMLNVSLFGIVVDPSGVYVAGNSRLGTAGIVIAKFSLLGALVWQRLLIAKDGNNTTQWYDYGTNTIAMHAGRLVVVGQTYAPSLNNGGRAIIAQFQTDGTRTAEYGPFVNNDGSGNQTVFDYHSSLFDVSEIIWNDTADLVPVLAPVTFVSSNASISDLRNVYTSIKFPKSSVEITADQMVLSREGNDALVLTAVLGGEVVKVNSELHGLQITPGAANAETHDTAFDDQALAGTLRTINGQIQTKVELNVGFNKDMHDVGGPVGYQAITPYQTQVHGPSLNLPRPVPGQDAYAWNNTPDLTIDFSSGKSVMWLIDPLHNSNAILPTGGLAGENYELFYKFANPVPGFNAFYPFNQYSNNNNGYSSNGMTGPLVVVASEGLREVCVISRATDRVFHTPLVSGLPREIAISANGLTFGDGYVNGGDTAFVSTTTGYIEMLGDDSYGGCRIYGVNQTSFLNLTPSINSDNNMDGYMWMDQVNNWLYAVGLSGDIWSIDATSITPTEQYHDVLPVGSHVLSVSGDQTANSAFGLLYILYTLNGTLKLHTIDNDSGDFNDLVLVTNFTGTANDLIVDPDMQQVYVTSSDGVHMHFIAVDTSTLSMTGIVNDQLITLTESYVPSDLRKCVGTVRTSSSTVYIPHVKEVIVVDNSTFEWGTVDMGGVNIQVDRLLLDVAQDWIVGTNTHQKPNDYFAPTSGVVIINNSDSLDDWWEGNNLGFTSVGFYPIGFEDGTVANYAALAGTPGTGLRGSVWLALDTGIYWMADGTGGYLSVNEYVNYSESFGGNSNDYDCLTLMPSNNIYPSDYNISVMPTSRSPGFNDGAIRFPDRGVMADGYNTFIHLPMPTQWNQIWVAKLSKASFMDDKNHDQFFNWYCTGIAGKYTWPQGY